MGWNEIIGVDFPDVNILVEMSGQDLPDFVEVKIHSRLPNRLPGAATINSPIFRKLPRVQGTNSYFLSCPIENLGSFLEVNLPYTLKKLATLHRIGGTSDSSFRNAGTWKMRGIGSQPSKVGIDTGEEFSEAPDGRRLILAGGVEVLDVSFSPVEGWDVQVRHGRTWRLIRSPADVFYYSGHGGTDLLIQRGRFHDPWLSAGDLIQLWPANLELDVFIIAGCSILEKARPQMAKLITDGPLVAILGYRLPDPLTKEQERLNQVASFSTRRYPRRRRHCCRNGQANRWRHPWQPAPDQGLVGGKSTL